MSRFYNELWQAVSKEQYEEVERLIRNHPEEDLINSVDEDGDSLLRRMANESPNTMNILQFMGLIPN